MTTLAAVLILIAVACFAVDTFIDTFPRAGKRLSSAGHALGWGGVLVLVVDHLSVLG